MHTSHITQRADFEYDISEISDLSIPEFTQLFSQADTCFQTFAYEEWINAIPTAQILQAKVTECVTDRGVRNSLTVKITNQQWGAFINEVNAQSGKKITVECAADLIEMATYLRDHP